MRSFIFLKISLLYTEKLFLRGKNTLSETFDYQDADFSVHL